MSALKLYGRFENETDDHKRWVMIPEASVWFVECDNDARLKLHNGHVFIVETNCLNDWLSEEEKQLATQCDDALNRWCGE